MATIIVLYWLFFKSITQRSTLIKGSGAECVRELHCGVKKIASGALSTAEAETQFSAFINFLNEKLREKRVV